AFFTRESHGGGIGIPGTLTHTVTSTVGNGLTALSNIVGKYSGLSHWDRFWKIISGLQMADDLRERVARYAGLSEQERTHLASLGIGEAEASRLQRYFTEHGEVDPQTGRWDPHLEEWHGTRDGQEAARDFRVAIQRDINRSRFWPGMGDRPLYM